MIDVQKIRKLFPILNEKINGNDLIYFDNGATTQKPKSVIDAINNYYTHENSNVHRGAHYLSQIATDKFEETRKKVQNFINAKKSCEIIFTKGTTDSINLVANGYKSILKEKDEVIITEMEHHSNIVPWQICCNQTKATLKIIPLNNDGDLDLEKFEKLLTKRTKLVAFSHVSNALGSINPIEEIIKKSHENGTRVLVDGAQAASHISLDMQKLNADFYCFSAHKMYGPTGVGVLYGKEDLLNDFPPYQGGGEMIKEVTLKKTSYASLPYKFEAGTPNICSIIAFSKSIDFILETGLDNMKTHEDMLIDYTIKKLSKIPNIIFVGQPKKRSAIISFNIMGLHHYDVGVLLDNMGIAIRTGHHCAQPIMKYYNILGTIRLSFAVYNTVKEIDQFINAIKKTHKMLN